LLAGGLIHKDGIAKVITLGYSSELQQRRDHVIMLFSGMVLAG